MIYLEPKTTLVTYPVLSMFSPNEGNFVFPIDLHKKGNEVKPQFLILHYLSLSATHIKKMLHLLMYGSLKQVKMYSNGLKMTQYKIF